MRCSATFMRFAAGSFSVHSYRLVFISSVFSLSHTKATFVRFSKPIRSTMARLAACALLTGLFARVSSLSLMFINPPPFDWPDDFSGSPKYKEGDTVNVSWMPNEDGGRLSWTLSQRGEMDPTIGSAEFLMRMKGLCPMATRREADFRNQKTLQVLQATLGSSEREKILQSRICSFSAFSEVTYRAQAANPFLSRRIPMRRISVKGTTCHRLYWYLLHQHQMAHRMQLRYQHRRPRGPQHGTQRSTPRGTHHGPQYQQARTYQASKRTNQIFPTRRCYTTAFH